MRLHIHVSNITEDQTYAHEFSVQFTLNLNKAPRW